MTSNKLQHALDLSNNTYPPQKIICRGENRDYSWADFCINRSAWEYSFQSIDSTTIALYSVNTFDFACALSALWSCGKTAILPGNNNPQTIKQLKQLTQYFAGDFSEIKKDNNAILLTQGPSDTIRHNINAKKHTNTNALIIFTSGSSGQPLPIEKTFQQLNNEIETLEDLWGQRLGNATITGTVSHQHIYGLLFRLLWPLTCGRKFVDRARDYSEEIFSDAQRFQNIATIMTPAHLAHLPVICTSNTTDHATHDINAISSANTNNTNNLSTLVRAVFSSAAPLCLDAAQDVLDKFQQEAIEIYGSSETGGVAYRQQLSNPYWSPLPNITIISHTKNETSLLCIKSPHLPSKEWFISADRCDKINSQGFILGKRTDRITKIGGKRISLSTIEQQLEMHRWIDKVRVITLSEHNNRTAALVVLNNLGNDQLIQHGLRFMNQQLALPLNGYIERIAIPRYWRYWDTIPHNQQGKISHGDITALFSRQPKPTEANLDNHSLCHNELNSVAELNLTIPHNLSWFEGHFPGRPILPGVIQTHWAQYYGHKFFSINSAFSHLEVIKFQQVIRPGETIKLSLKWTPATAKLTFTYSSNQNKLSSGRIVFENTNTYAATKS